MTNLDSILKSRDVTLPTKGCLVKVMVFPIVKYVCESWTIKKAERQRLIFWTIVLEKILESPLNSREIKPVNPKGNQSWILIVKTDAKAEAPILWPRNARSQLIRKGPYVGKDWRQEKGTTEDEVVGWHHRLNGCEFEKTLEYGDGQESLASCNPWRHKELDKT